MLQGDGDGLKEMGMGFKEMEMGLRGWGWALGDGDWFEGWGWASGDGDGICDMIVMGMMCRYWRSV